MPHTRALGDGLFVLRLKAKEGIGRVFFCTITLPASSTSSKRQTSTGVNRKIVMLHSLVKKSQKTPKKELETARRRLSEFRNSQN
jgi:phage-related protein